MGDSQLVVASANLSDEQRSTLVQDWHCAVEAWYQINTLEGLCSVWHRRGEPRGCRPAYVPPSL